MDVMSDVQLYLTAAISAVACAILTAVWHRTRRSQQRVAVLSLVVAALSLVATIIQVVMAVLPARKPAPPPPEATGCKATVTAGFSRSDPEKVGDLTFCPTRVNDGDMHITGPFKLAGQVLGPVEKRRDMVLFVRLDQATCTTEGKPAAPGRFLINSVHFDLEADGGWSYRDNLGGHPPAVSLGRSFEFAIASKDAIQSLLDRHDEWRLSGITTLPPGIRILTHFDVPPGDSPSAVPCVGS
jgi:hypothetical protein